MEEIKKEDLSKEKQLMYDIIFSFQEEYEIHLLEYIQEIEFLQDFTERVLLNLKEAGIKIKEQIFILTKEKKSWILKIKR